MNSINILVSRLIQNIKVLRRNRIPSNSGILYSGRVENAYLHDLVNQITNTPGLTALHLFYA